MFPELVQIKFTLRTVLSAETSNTCHFLVRASAAESTAALGLLSEKADTPYLISFRVICLSLNSQQRHFMTFGTVLLIE